MKKVLVLDISYLPVNVVSWRKAILYLTKEKAEAIKLYDTKIKTPSKEVEMPAIIRFLQKYKQIKRVVKFSRQNVFARDLWCCQYCGHKFNYSDLTYDHVIPKSKIGSPGTCWENIVSCCIPCNIKKGDRLIEDIGMTLMKKPVRPKWLPTFLTKLSGDIPNIWKEYCYIDRSIL